MSRVLLAPYRGLLAVLPERAATRIQILAWRLARPLLLAVDAMRPARRRKSRLALILVAWELDENGALAAIDAAGAAPDDVLLVTAGDALGALRRAGCAVEHVPGDDELSRLPELDARAFQERRLRSILASYPHDRLILAGNAPAEVRRVLSTLAADVRELDT